jgi:hypothetical protein
MDTGVAALLSAGLGLVGAVTGALAGSIGAVRGARTAARTAAETAQAQRVGHAQAEHAAWLRTNRQQAYEGLVVALSGAVAEDLQVYRVLTKDGWNTAEFHLRRRGVSELVVSATVKAQLAGVPELLPTLDRVGAAYSAWVRYLVACGEAGEAWDPGASDAASLDRSIAEFVRAASAVISRPPLWA